MNYCVECKEDVIDQFGTIRLIKGKLYEATREFEDTFEIIDETGKSLIISKHYFYYERDGMYEDN